METITGRILEEISKNVDFYAVFEQAYVDDEELKENSIERAKEMATEKLVEEIIKNNILFDIKRAEHFNGYIVNARVKVLKQNGLWDYV